MLNPVKFYLFDMDHTLIGADCDVTWKYFLVKHNLAPASDIAKTEEFFQDYLKGELDQSEFFHFQFREFIGKTYEQMRPLAEAHFDEYIRGQVYRQAGELLHELADGGMRRAIMTSTNSVIAAPVARFLGVPELYATTLATDDRGRYTGDIVGHLVAGEGKVVEARRVAAEAGIPLEDFAFYGDSINDSNVLRVVGHPHTVNPSGALLELAKNLNWPILSWS